jgi:lysozyme
VSHHQGVVDWAKVKAAGASFVYLKATEGATYVDPTFKTNWAATKAAGLPRGAYHFFRAKTSTVEDQVKNFAAVLNSVEAGELAPVLDVEVPEQWEGIDVKKRTDMMIDFCDHLTKALVTHPEVIVYLSPSFADKTLANDPRLAKYTLWLAHYTAGTRPRVPAPWTTWRYWQYTETGTVDGINTKCDVNRLNGGESEFKTLIKKTVKKNKQNSKQSRKSK